MNVQKRLPARETVERAIRERLPWTIDRGTGFGKKQQRYRQVLRDVEREFGLEGRKEFVRLRKSLYRPRKALLKQLDSWVAERVKRFPLFYGVFVHGSFAYGKAEPKDIDLIPLFHPNASEEYIRRVFGVSYRAKGTIHPENPFFVAGERRVLLEPFWWKAVRSNAGPYRLDRHLFEALFDDFYSVPLSPEQATARHEERGGPIIETWVKRSPDLFIGDPTTKRLIESMYAVFFQRPAWQQASDAFNERIGPKIREFNRERERKQEGQAEPK